MRRILLSVLVLLATWPLVAAEPTRMQWTIDGVKRP